MWHVMNMICSVIFLVLILFKGALDYESFSTALYGESDL